MRKSLRVKKNFYQADFSVTKGIQKAERDLEEVEENLSILPKSEREQKLQKVQALLEKIQLLDDDDLDLCARWQALWLKMLRLRKENPV